MFNEKKEEKLSQSDEMSPWMLRKIGKIFQSFQEDRDARGKKGSAQTQYLDATTQQNNSGSQATRTDDGSGRGWT